MTEGQIHNAFIAWLRKNRLSYVNHRMDRKSGIAVGFPDFCIVHCGRALLIEVKTPKGKLSQAQQKMIRDLNLNGTVTEVCRSVGQCVATVETWMGLIAENLSGDAMLSLAAPSARQNTTSRDDASRPAVAEAEIASPAEGPATAPDKPLMRKVNGNDAPAATGHTATAKLFIANVAGKDRVCRGSGLAGSQFEIVRVATAADLINLK